MWIIAIEWGPCSPCQSSGATPARSIPIQSSRRIPRRLFALRKRPRHGSTPVVAKPLKVLIDLHHNDSLNVRLFTKPQ
jgi:hypothetical protein